MEVITGGGEFVVCNPPTSTPAYPLGFTTTTFHWMAGRPKAYWGDVRIFFLLMRDGWDSLSLEREGEKQKKRLSF